MTRACWQEQEIPNEAQRDSREEPEWILECAQDVAVFVCADCKEAGRVPEFLDDGGDIHVFGLLSCLIVKSYAFFASDQGDVLDSPHRRGVDRAMPPKNPYLPTALLVRRR